MTKSMKDKVKTALNKVTVKKKNNKPDSNLVVATQGMVNKVVKKWAKGDSFREIKESVHPTKSKKTLSYKQIKEIISIARTEYEKDNRLQEKEV